MSELVEILQRNKVKALLAIPGSFLLVRCIIHWYHRYRLYKAISEQQEKCKEAFSTITEELKSVTLDEKEQQRIFELTSAQLQQELQKGKITAVDVLQVYQSQALEVNKRLNAVVEPLVDAKTLASACDPNAPEKGILFGIPISVKENFFIKGKASTAGMVQFLEKINSSDAVLIQVVKSQGGIPFVRTNIPQTMMTYESSNPIYGRTNNPFDVKRIPGGSSSGEGSLIGSGASIIGLGSDIGGSIRVPCHFCGCYGLKPTSERLSRKGSFSFSSGQTLIRGSLGPMARDMEGVVLAMKGLLCDLHFTLDSEVPPIKFRDEIYNGTKPLRIGFYVDDGFIPAVPAVQRAVLLAKKALETLGHTVVEFTPPRTKYAIPDLYVGTVGGDRNEQFTTYLDNDVIDPTVIALMLPIQGPKWTTWLLSMLIQFAARDPNTGRMLRARNGKSSVYEWFRHGQKFQDYRYEFEEAWKTQNLDAVICPPFACTAVPHGDIFNVISAGCYSMLYNILNYPAGVVPVTRVTVDDVSNMANYPRSTATQKNIHKVMVGSEGLPVGVQCVALPFQEELVLRVMRDVRDGMQT